MGKNRVKQLSLVGIWLKQRQITEKNLFGRALVRIRSEIEKNTHFGKALVRVRAKIEKKHPLWYDFS